MTIKSICQSSGHRGKGEDSWEARLGMERLDIKGTSEKLEEELKLNSTEPTPEEQAPEASYDREQVIELAQRDLNMLAGLAMPAVFEHLFPKILLAAWMLLTQMVAKTKDFSKIALGIPRGHGKTTLIKLFILYCILFTKRKFILVVSDTEQKAINIISDTMDMLSESNMMRLFGDWKLGRETDNQQIKKFGFRGRVIILVAIGVGGSMRGLNLKNARPDVMIFDDIQSAEAAESPVVSASLERWMIGTAMKAKSPHGCLYIYAGNMFPGDNCILKHLKQNPSWVKFISGAILADGTALWPELHSIPTLIEELDNDIAMGHPEIFFAETLNDTEAGINTKTDLSQLKPWKWTEHDRPQGKFIIIDPATGKLGKDLTAIGLCEVYDETPALREIIEENLSPGNTIRRALVLALRNNCKVIAVESTAYQSTLLYWFETVSKDLGITGLHFVEVYGNNSSKNSRISAALRSLTAGEIVLHPSIRSQMIQQIINWNPMKRDNVDGLLDLLAYLIKCIELYGHLMSMEDSLLVLEANATDVQEDNWAF